MKMQSLNLIFEFSRIHCGLICAVLVPANLLATLQTLLLVGQQRPRSQVQIMALAASLWALIMLLHVATWLMVGIVMVPTFILLSLGFCCLAINSWAIGHPASLTGLLLVLWSEGRSRIVPNS